MSTTELKTAQLNARQKSEDFKDALEKIEDAAEKKVKKVNDIVDTVQSTIHAPQRFAETVAAKSKVVYSELERRSRPVVKHIRDNPVAYFAGVTAVGIALALISARSRRKRHEPFSDPCDDQM